MLKNSRFNRRFITATCLLGLLVARGVGAQDPPKLSLTCSVAGQDTCAETNQICGVLADNNAEAVAENEICFACQVGFVQLADNLPCIDVSNLTMSDFLAVHPEPIFGNRDLPLAQRLPRLRQAAQIVSEINAANRPFRLAINQFSAETAEEEAKRNGFRVNDDDEGEDAVPVPGFAATTTTNGLPDAIDWAKEGYVSIVKNQASCGCCWSVAAVGAAESKYLIDMANQNETLQINLSFQQLISCDDTNGGCDGGSTTRALQYAHDNSFGGVTSWIEYPYKDRQGETTDTCELRSNMTVAYRPPEARMVVERNDRKASFGDRLQRMKQGLAEQPVAVAIKAGCVQFMSYSSGVLTEDFDCSCSESKCLDHAVLMVGYNDTHDPPYFKIKNSWGVSWGENGYVRIAQTSKGDYGLFGVLAEGVFPSSNQEFDEAKDPLKLWQVLLIALGSALALSAIVFALWECIKRMSSKDSSPE